MIPKMLLSGRFCVLYLVGDKFWAFTLNQLATILRAVIGQNGYLSPTEELQMDHLAGWPYFSFGHDPIIETMGIVVVTFTRLVVFATCLSPLVLPSWIASHYSVVVEH